MRYRTISRWARRSAAINVQRNALPLLLPALMLCAGCATARAPFHETEIAAVAPSRTPIEVYWANALERLIGDSAAGYAYAVYYGAEPVAVGAAGYARLPSDDDSLGLKMMAQTPMQIASVSKSITAVALLHALKARSINIDDPIWPHLQQQFPEAAPKFEKITARHLLTHCTGYAFGYLETPRLANTRKVIQEGPTNKPGGECEYSNINTSLARRLVLLPLEDHGYRARESVEHVLWEQLRWFDEHVKGVEPDRSASAGR
jgi:CubicO group peptidase (beta-lactamase class C family)